MKSKILYTFKSMLKKHKLILFLAPISILLYVWFVSLSFGNTPPLENIISLGEKVNLLPHTKNEIVVSSEDFSFKIPKNWTQDDLEEEGLDGLLVVRISRENPYADFRVRTLSGAENIDFTELPRELRASFLKKTKGFKEIKLNKEKINSLDSLKYEYEYKEDTSTGDYITHQEMVITLFKNKVYYLVGQARKTDYNKVRSEISSIFDSIRFE